MTSKTTSALPFFTCQAPKKILITPILSSSFNNWLKKQPAFTKTWLKTNNFCAKSGSHCLIPNSKGEIAEVLLGLEDENDFWAFGNLPLALSVKDSSHSSNVFQIRETKASQELSKLQLQKCAIAWGLGCYQFTKYKKAEKTPAKLFIPAHYDYEYIKNVVSSAFLVRDLINKPAEDLGPAELSQIAIDIAKQHGAQSIKQIVGNDLLRNHYPLVHAVGRASSREPRLVEFVWGNKLAPKLVLVGKGICFDSGGLDLKPPTAMDKMKTDMVGAAHALGLAQMIMEAKLPIMLHVILPLAENLVAANSYKPGDIFTSRQGKTVEILNTDAEGRLLLADALARATEVQPDLIIDFASLTGAATIAVGPEIIAMFSNDDNLSKIICDELNKEKEPICNLPLYKPYRELLDSKIADIGNCSSSGYAGAITAALFLQEFVPNNFPWLHFDLHGANAKSKAGRPEGGEAMGLKGLFAYLKQHFAKA